MNTNRLSNQMNIRALPSSGVCSRAQFQNKVESSTSPSQGRRGLAFATFGALSLSLSLSLLASIFFSHSAYATAPYLNVSSGAPEGLVKFEKVQPSATGEMSTAQDNLTINTNCSIGYNVYISATNNGDTNLTNDSASGLGNNIISTSSATVGGTATALSPNTWGINGNSVDASDNKYFGLPTYAKATDNPLVTKASVVEQTTVPIYYGAKVTTAIAPGTYSGDVLYTVLPNNACNYYTVAFHANGGTGTMDAQTITYGEATKLTANAFTRSGYTFLGWSTTQVAGGIGTVDDVEYFDRQSVNIDTFNTTIDLYAVWAAVFGDMQGWTGCSSLSANQSVYLTDTRDGKVYAVKKLPDGKCWMMQNLTIGSDGAKTLTNAGTNINDGVTYYLPPAGKQGSSTIDNSSTLTATDAANFSTTNDNRAKTQFRDRDADVVNDSDTGYYNFYTATLGYAYYGTGTSGSSSNDICPKGWRLPNTTDAGTTVSAITSVNDFTYLARQYSTSGWQGTATSYYYYISDASSVVHTGLHTGVAANGNNYAGFSYSGYWDGTNTSASYVGSNGYYWSSSVYNTGSGYILYFDSSGVYPQGSGYKYSGVAVRCIAQSNYTVAYNVNGASGAPSKTSEPSTLFETDKFTTATVHTMAKTGYHFLGWSTNSSATTAAYNAGTDVNMATLISDAAASGQSTATGSTLTLYAVWAPNTFTISYNANSGSGSASGGTTSATYGVNITMASKGTLSRSGYDFLGWSLSSSATTATWTAGQSGIAPTAIKSNITTTDGGSVIVYAVWKQSTTYTLSYSNVNFATSNKPSTQTYTGTEATHTFTIPSSTPTSYTPLSFSNYTYNGSTYSPGSTIKLSSSSPTATLTANWSRSCTISASQGCKLADDKTWIYGNSGNSITWSDTFSGATNADGHNATVKSGICPSGYSAPAITDFDTLVQAYGGAVQTFDRKGYREMIGTLYAALGLSDWRYFWSSTERKRMEAYVLRIPGSTSSLSSAANLKDPGSSSSSHYFVLCYK